MAQQLLFLSLCILLSVCAISLAILFTGAIKSITNNPSVFKDVQAILYAGLAFIEFFGIVGIGVYIAIKLSIL